MLLFSRCCLLARKGVHLISVNNIINRTCKLFQQHSQWITLYSKPLFTLDIHIADYRLRPCVSLHHIMTLRRLMTSGNQVWAHRYGVQTQAHGGSQRVRISIRHFPPLDSICKAAISQYKGWLSQSSTLLKHLLMMIKITDENQIFLSCSYLNKSKNDENAMTDSLFLLF